MSRKTSEAEAINIVVGLKMPPHAIARSLGGTFSQDRGGWRYRHSLTGISPPRGHVGYASETEAIAEFLRRIVYILGSARDSL